MRPRLIQTIETKNIKLLDIDRKFYNRQCNLFPFDIVKKKNCGNFVLRCIQFIELVLCVSE